MKDQDLLTIHHEIFIQNTVIASIYSKSLEWMINQNVDIQNKIVNNRIEGVHSKKFISGFRNDYYSDLSEKRISLSFSSGINGVNLSITIYPIKEMKIIRDQFKMKLIWSDYVIDLYNYLNIDVDNIILRELYPNSFLTSYLDHLKVEIRNNFSIICLILLFLSLKSGWISDEFMRLFWMMIGSIVIYFTFKVISVLNDYNRVLKLRQRITPDKARLT